MDLASINRMVSFLVAMLLSLTVHEYSHALVAWWLGDRTAESQGRMSLNPLVHIDPIGTIAMPIIGAISGFALFGWAKPVPTNPLYYTRKIGGKRISMTAGMALVASAGPISNLLFAAVIAIALNLSTYVVAPTAASAPLYTLAMRVFMVNIGLFVFNLIPLPPLDGSRILYWLLPDRQKPLMDTLSRNTPFIFIGFLLLMQTSLFNRVFFVPIIFLLQLFASVFGIGSFFNFM